MTPELQTLIGHGLVVILNLITALFLRNDTKSLAERVTELEQQLNDCLTKLETATD